MIENRNHPCPADEMEVANVTRILSISQKACYGQKGPFFTVIDSVAFRSIRCDSCFPLTFIYAQVTKTGKKQNNNYHLKSMADTSKNNQQRINKDWFSVLQGLHRFSS